ncbi:MAG: hypothetical protein ABIQ93_03300, partial [Saprospiraceae bacterium]
MALQVGTQGRFKTLSGLYQGQSSPVRIGAHAGNVGPNIYGYILHDDGISFNAYFDPTQSPTASTGRWNLITYIGVGIFSVNGVPVSATLHDERTPWAARLGHQTDFVDVPQFNSQGQANIKPYYPSWAYQANSAVPTANLYKFPQDYGGYTKHDGIPFSNGAFLAASMHKTIGLSTGSLPIRPVRLHDFFRQLDFSGLDPLFNS